MNSVNNIVCAIVCSFMVFSIDLGIENKEDDQDGVVVADQEIWRWGAGQDILATTAVSVNDVRPLLLTTAEGVIVST